MNSYGRIATTGIGTSVMNGSLTTLGWHHLAMRRGTAGRSWSVQIYGNPLHLVLALTVWV